jgi:hypothetical protein
MKIIDAPLFSVRQFVPDGGRNFDLTRMDLKNGRNFHCWLVLVCLGIAGCSTRNQTSPATPGNVAVNSSPGIPETSMVDTLAAAPVSAVQKNSSTAQLEPGQRLIAYCSTDRLKVVAFNFTSFQYEAVAEYVFPVPTELVDMSPGFCGSRGYSEIRYDQERELIAALSPTLDSFLLGAAQDTTFTSSQVYQIGNTLDALPTGLILDSIVETGFSERRLLRLEPYWRDKKTIRWSEIDSLKKVTTRKQGTLTDLTSANPFTVTGASDEMSPSDKEVFYESRVNSQPGTTDNIVRRAAGKWIPVGYGLSPDKERLALGGSTVDAAAFSKVVESDDPQCETDSCLTSLDRRLAPCGRILGWITNDTVLKQNENELFVASDRTKTCGPNLIPETRKNITGVEFSQSKRLIVLFTQDSVTKALEMYKTTLTDNTIGPLEPVTPYQPFFSGLDFIYTPE